MTPSTRLPGLDLLRSVAVVWVMLFHSFLVGGLGPDWSWLSRYGWMGVDLFFVLSGYLIGTQVLAPLARGEKLAFGAFYLRRGFRILPAYLAMLALYACVPAVREAGAMEPAWKFLTFTVNLHIDYLTRGTFSHAWSLCVEEHFYLLFPLLAGAVVRRGVGARRVMLMGCVVVVAGVLLRAAIWQHDMAADPTMVRNWFVEDLYYPTWNRLDGLLAGVALAAWKVFRPGAWRAARRWAGGAALAGLVAMGMAFALFQQRTGLLANTVGWPVLSLAVGLLVFAAAERDNLLGRCRVPFSAGLAAMSYSLYLVHKAAYHVVQAQWGHALSPWPGLAAAAVYGGVALLAGATMHWAVERPALRWRDRLLDARRARGAACAGQAAA